MGPNIYSALGQRVPVNHESGRKGNDWKVRKFIKFTQPTKKIEFETFSQKTYSIPVFLTNKYTSHPSVCWKTEFSHHCPGAVKAVSELKSKIAMKQSFWFLLSTFILHQPGLVSIHAPTYSETNSKRNLKIGFLPRKDRIIFQPLDLQKAPQDSLENAPQKSWSWSNCVCVRACLLRGGEVWFCMICLWRNLGGWRFPYLSGCLDPLIWRHKGW